HGVQVQHPRHPDAPAVQGGPGRRAGRRSGRQGRAQESHRQARRMTDARNVIVIGSGPARLTAALYSARANLKPPRVEGLEAGGQLMLTTLVENFPGFPKGIMGPELMGDMRAQAEHFGADIVRAHATSVDLMARPYVVRTSDAEYRGRSLIIATGASARL